MEIFRAYDAGPDSLPAIAAQLREHGLAVLTGLAGRAELSVLAARLMTVRPHRDAAPDGITEITDTGATGSGYAAFTGAGLVPHTDGTAVADPPQLMLLACIRPADDGGATLVADGARVIAALAGQHPGALRALSAPRAAWFGTAADGHLGAVFGPAGPGRAGIRLRLDELARFSPDAAAAVPALREVIERHTAAVHLRPGNGIAVCNTRWLHGRQPYTGRRVMLRILGDPLPGAGVLPGFPAPPAAQASTEEAHAQ